VWTGAARHALHKFKPVAAKSTQGRKKSCPGKGSTSLQQRSYEHENGHHFSSISAFSSEPALIKTTFLAVVWSMKGVTACQWSRQRGGAVIKEHVVMSCTVAGSPEVSSAAAFASSDTAHL
jgi:hypothetical protein